MSFPSIDHSLLSPSGRMSKRARKQALAREHARLFKGVEWTTPPKERTVQERITQLEELAKLAGPRQAKKLRAEAEELRRTL